MKADKEMIKIIQRQLNRRQNQTLAADGDAGPKTMAALALVSTIPSTWEKERKLIGYIQYVCMLEGVDAGPVDGFWGPQTQYGYEQLKAKLREGRLPEPWRDDEGIGATPTTESWPIQTQEELVKFYGAVGTNQAKVNVPYPLKIAWAPEKTINRFTCHEKVADSIFRILVRVQDHYGDQISNLGLDLWGGCLNVRKMRGGSKWSTHSWGIAIDWDPVRNQLRWGKDKANFAKSEYDMWWKLWEEEGWVSLGRARDYDWMHVQAARVK